MKAFLKKLWHEMSGTHNYKELPGRRQTSFTSKIERCDCGMERSTFSV